MLERITPTLARGCVFAALTAALCGAASAAETIATGLYNPRGLAFAPNGLLYVAEAGDSTEADTSAVTQINLKKGTQQRILAGLPSLSGGEAVGVIDIAFGGGEGYMLFGLGFAQSPYDYPDFAKLARFTPAGQWWNVADPGVFEWEYNPDGPNSANCIATNQDPACTPKHLDSNPYGLLALPGKQIIADAGANDILERKANGTLKVLSVLPNGALACPPGPPGPCAAEYGDPVPTTVVLGPDGNYYVGQLQNCCGANSGASIYRINPKGGVAVPVAGGFGSIIDLAFDSQGHLFVLEIFANGVFAPGGGGLIEIKDVINHPEERCYIAGHNSPETLAQPGGIAVGAGGDLYVTDIAQGNGTGVVLKLKACN